MSGLTPHNVLIGLIAIVALIIVIAVAARLFLSGEPHAEYDDPYDPDNDEYDDDDEDYDDDEEAVEIDATAIHAYWHQGGHRPVEYGPQTFEMADLTLRITKPHLFADNWFDTAYREFSEWKAQQDYLQARHRKECGLAA